MKSFVQISFVALFGLTLLLTGCEAGKDDFIREGRKAARTQNYEEALKQFKQALAIAPDDYNAMWGIADAYARQGKLGDEAAMLHKIRENEKFKKDYAGVLNPALETNYRKRAEAIMGSEPAKAEELLRKAIKLNKKSEAHQSLASLLMMNGDNFLRKAQFKEAAAAFKAATKLRIARKLRSKLKGKAEIAGFFAFKKEFQARFDKVKAELVADGTYDEKRNVFILSAEAEVDRPNRKDPQYQLKSQRAGLYAITVKLDTLAWKLAGKPRPENMSLVTLKRSHVKVIEQGAKKKGRKHFYHFKIELPEDALIETVQLIDEGKIKTKEEAAKEAAEAAKKAQEKAAKAAAKAAKGAPAKAAPAGAAKAAPAAAPAKGAKPAGKAPAKK